MESPLVLPPGLLATFDLTGLEPGTYDVRVTDGTSTSELPSGLARDGEFPGPDHIQHIWSGRDSTPPAWYLHHFRVQKNTGGTSVPAPRGHHRGAEKRTPGNADTRGESALTAANTIFRRWGWRRWRRLRHRSLSTHGLTIGNVRCCRPRRAKRHDSPGFDGFYTIPFEPLTFGATSRADFESSGTSAGRHADRLELPGSQPPAELDSSRCLERDLRQFRFPGRRYVRPAPAGHAGRRQLSQCNRRTHARSVPVARLRAGTG